MPLVHTEEVTASIPVSPTDVRPAQRLHGQLSSYALDGSCRRMGEIWEIALSRAGWTTGARGWPRPSRARWTSCSTAAHRSVLVDQLRKDREDAHRVFRVLQRERGGVIAGERVRDMKGPAGRVPGGAWCSGCRRCAHSDEVISLTAARAAVWSTIFLPVT